MASTRLTRRLVNAGSRWMMIRSCYDGGRGWENAEQGTRITSDWSGYSDRVQLS